MLKKTFYPFTLVAGLLALSLNVFCANEPVSNEGNTLISVPDALSTVKKDKNLLSSHNDNANDTPEATSDSDSANNTEPPNDDLWDRIRTGFGMPDLNDPTRIQRQIDWYVARPDYIERTVDRSKKYLFFIVEEVQRRKMPTEIALLPIVESAFNPHALSISQASGIWQFIPATGRLYGMEQSFWYDGRRDVVAATNSALDYLQRLHDEFGSWELALAGYNCGEGKIRREIAYNKARHLPTDYLSLNLPNETRNYVPKLLAAKAIVLNPKRYGLTLDTIPNEPYFAVITTTKKIDTKLAAQFAGMSVEDFVMLNPAFNRPVITLNFHHEQNILVPAQMADSFVTKLEDPEVKLVTWKTQHLKRGESLESVANRFGMSSEELKKINGISTNKKIAGGGTILVPNESNEDEPNLDTSNAKPEADIPSPGLIKIKTSKTDTLASLAKKYDTTPQQLEQWNHLKPGSKLKAGHWLIVQAGPAPSTSKKTHKQKTKVTHRHTHHKTSKAN